MHTVGITITWSPGREDPIFPQIGRKSFYHYQVQLPEDARFHSEHQYVLSDTKVPTGLLSYTPPRLL